MIRLTRGTLVVDHVAELNRPSSPRQGQRVYERSSGQLLQWDGEKDGEGGWVVVEQPEGPEMPW